MGQKLLWASLLVLVVGDVPVWPAAKREFFPDADALVDLATDVDDVNDAHTQPVYGSRPFPELGFTLPNGDAVEGWVQRMYTEVSTLGALDVLENNEDLGARNANEKEGWKASSVPWTPFSSGFGFTDTCSGWTRARASRLPHAEVQRRVKTLVSVCLKFPHIAKLYASGTLIELSAMVLNELGETSASAPPPHALPPQERRTLDEIFPLLRGTRYCDSVFVVCSIRGGELRVTGLRLVPVIPQSAHRTFCRSHSTRHRGSLPSSAGRDARDTLAVNPTTLPGAVRELSMLRMLVFFPLAVVNQAVSAAEACTFLQSLPRLEVLALGAPLPHDCALPTLRSLQFFGRSHAIFGENQREGAGAPAGAPGMESEDGASRVYGGDGLSPKTDTNHARDTKRYVPNYLPTCKDRP